MKFALIALIATVASIKMTSLVQSPCVSQGTSDYYFNKIDTDNTGLLNGDELYRALQDVRRRNRDDVSVQEIKDIFDVAVNYAGSNDKLNKQEFNEFTNKIANDLGDC